MLVLKHTFHQQKQIWKSELRTAWQLSNVTHLPKHQPAASFGLFWFPIPETCPILISYQHQSWLLICICILSLDTLSVRPHLCDILPWEHSTTSAPCGWRLGVSWVTRLWHFWSASCACMEVSANCPSLRLAVAEIILLGQHLQSHLKWFDCKQT